jgi:AcrR family transcriptional regulator
VDNAAHIRTVATQLFAALGYDGTSLQAIAERVGVTKQTLLYHYPSKDALRRAVLDQVFAHFRERLPQMLEAVTGGHDRFEALTRELVQFFEGDPDRALLLVRELLDNPANMRRVLGDNLRPWVMLVGQYVRQGQQSGLIHADVDPEAFVLNVVVSVLATVAVRPIAVHVLGDEAAAPDGEARPIRELFRTHRAALFTPRRSVQTSAQEKAQDKPQDKSKPATRRPAARGDDS